MRFDRESWRKLYISESMEHRMLSLFARGLRDYLLRFAEEDGTLLRHTEDPARDLAVVLSVVQPAERRQLKQAVADLLRVGYLAYDGGRLSIAKFVEAQTARSPAAKRQKAFRDRQRAKKESDAAGNSAAPLLQGVTGNATGNAAGNATVTLQIDETRRDETRRQQQPSPEDGIPCPPDLALSEAQATNREMAGCPRWAQEAITRSFVGRYLADPDDRRTLATWRKCLDVAIGTTWSDPNKRPQRPAESSPDAAAAARRAAEQRREESRRRAREALFGAQATLGAPPPQRRVTGAAPAEQSPSSKVTDAREVES